MATVAAETSGRVDGVLVDVGDRVAAGAVIITLVGVEQRQELNQARAAVHEAESNLQADEAEYQRINALYQRRLVAKVELDRITARYSSGKARLSSAQAALQTARRQLSYTEVRAPYGGVVSARHVELGEAVSPGTLLMSGFDPLSLRVHVDLPQQVAQRFRELQQIRVEKDDGRALAITESRIFPTADPATSTVRVRLNLQAQQDVVLYPGQFVRVAVTVGNTERLLVPQHSVVYRASVAAVYVVRAEQGAEGIQLRQVRLGRRFGDQVEVLAGLEAGESIAADPVVAGIQLATERHAKDAQP